MVPADSSEPFCAACRHNGIIPDISDPVNHLRWQKIEASKRRLVYSLINLNLPLPAAATGDWNLSSLIFLGVLLILQRDQK